MTDYAPSRNTTEGRVYNLTGGDWDSVMAEVGPFKEERLVLNMGPQHPSTHGVLRMVTELEGETVTDMRTVIGYLHTGIEKNVEFRTWTLGVTFLTRADYLAPLFNEAVYCMAVEKLLGVEVPARAQLIRLILMEVNRVSSHWVALATGGMEMGALTAMTNWSPCARALHPGHVRADHRPADEPRVRAASAVSPRICRMVPSRRWTQWIKEFLAFMPERLEIKGLRTLVGQQPIWINRLKDVGWLGVEGCISLGVTGPMLRAAGLPWDLRKTDAVPAATRTFDFEVHPDDRRLLGPLPGPPGRDVGVN